MNIIVKTIPHNEQRYDTCGDWWFDENNNLQIRVSDTGNWKYELLISRHEIIEACLCKDRGISEKAVSDFDIQFENDRLEGNNDEPGFSPNAPYRKEHTFATLLERQEADELRVNWEDYENTLNNL